MARNPLIADVDQRVLRTSIVVAGLCLGTFLLLRLLILLLDGPSPFDIWLSDHIRQPHPSQGLKIIERLASSPGSGRGAMALILGVAAWAWLRRRDLRPGALLIAVFVVTKASVKVLKILLDVEWHPPTGEMEERAFFSSHAAVSVAVLGILVVVLWLFGRRDLLLPAVAVAIVVVSAVALSLIAMDMHYFVDVLSGAALGGFWVAVFALVGDLMWKRLPAPMSPASSREVADQVHTR